MGFWSWRDVRILLMRVLLTLCAAIVLLMGMLVLVLAMACRRRLEVVKTTCLVVGYRLSGVLMAGESYLFCLLSEKWCRERAD
jgi:hypothetical protein